MAGSLSLVLVPVAGVGGVAVLAVQVVDVVLVWDEGVAAAGPVLVRMVAVLAVAAGAFVPVLAMLAVGVAIVQVMDVAVVLDGCVPTPVVVAVGMAAVGGIVRVHSPMVAARGKWAKALVRPS